MKKLIGEIITIIVTVMLFVGLLMWAMSVEASCVEDFTGNFIEPCAGDVYLWTSDNFLLWGVPLPVGILGIIYGEVPSFTHADVCVTEEGRLRTSIQGKGVSSSTVNKRKLNFVSGVQLRNTTLTKDMINIVCNTAYTLEGSYDYGGYDGQGLDYLIRVPYTPRGYFFTALLQDPELYYCSEFVVECFLSADVMTGVRIHPAPNDIYYTVNDTDWEIVGTWEN